MCTLLHWSNVLISEPIEMDFKRERTISIWILVIVGIALVIYAIILYVTFKNGTFIFAPYTPPPLPNSFQPLGAITPLTPAQQAARKEAYTRPPT